MLAKALSASALQWATVLCAATTPVLAATLNARMVGGGVKLRIMPLGASITHGMGSTTGNGYREDLRGLLNADGNDVEYVGSQTNGPMENNANEGWPGKTISEVFDKAKESVPKTLPNLVLINAGTNDCVQGNSALAGEDMREMLHWIWLNSVRATIVLSTLNINSEQGTDDCLQGINEQLRRVVEEEQAISKKVVLADMRGEGGLTLDDLSDSIHPNDQGFTKMAGIWFAAIQDASSRGWLEAPQDLPVTDVNNDQPPQTNIPVNEGENANAPKPEEAIEPVDAESSAPSKREILRVLGSGINMFWGDNSRR